MNILQVNTHDIAGGAARVALDLQTAYRQTGHQSWLEVGYKQIESSDAIRFPQKSPRSNPLSSFFWSIKKSLKPFEGRFRGAYFFEELLGGLADIPGEINRRSGREDFHFPGTRLFLDVISARPDILQLHNLHGDYFDLRMLPEITRRIPTVLTLHDAWLLSGHCAHSFGCERWKVGCGNCPDLTIPPAIQRDGTRINWKVKQEIFSQSNYFVAAPSKWLMDKVDQSILANNSLEKRIIPNGVDISIFKPLAKDLIREKMNIPQNSCVLLFVSSGVKNNPFKDFNTLIRSVDKVARLCPGEHIILLMLGENIPLEGNLAFELRNIPFSSDRNFIAQVYNAADIYLHSARQETFPLSILEAMACGISQVASSVGGIPELIVDGDTGFLAPVGDSDRMAEHICFLLKHSEFRQTMGEKAALRAKFQYSLQTQAQNYLDWFNKIVSKE